MTPPKPRASTQGYAEQSAQLTIDYENLSFADVHRTTRHLFPKAPSRILDIGAGTGRDAAALAEAGHHVLAVEPTAELRQHGQRIHPSKNIAWLDDGLPELQYVLARGEAFDLILLTAVWMHIDAAERSIAMPNLTRLLAVGGQIVLTLRHGPVPAGRRMFEVGQEETAALAQQHGLQCTFAADYADPRGRGGVHWTAIALRRVNRQP